MLRLYLLRHAKSSWDDSSLDDFDRPLTARGKRSCKKIANYLRKHNYQPDKIKLSPAFRSKETLRYINLEYELTPNLSYCDSLYCASSSRIIQEIKQTSSDFNSLMIIAHNPGIWDCALNLYGGGSHSNHLSAHNNYPTAGLAVYDFDLDDWNKITKAQLVDYTFPKAL